MAWLPRNLLVTGGAGFIGANFVHYWLGRYPLARVVVLDALTYAGNLGNLASITANPRFAFVQGDICDQARVEALLEEHDIDTLVHFAAESHVDRSIAGPDAFVTTNILGTHALLKACRRVWVDVSRPHRFHHVSTDEVFGSLAADAPGFSECSPYAPNSPYAASKAAADHLVRAYVRTFGLCAVTTNCSNNYGPYQFPEKLLPLMILNILHGSPLPIYGDGCNVRDWLHVTDHCTAIDSVLHRGQTGETYNIGGNNELRNIDLVHELCATCDQLFASDESIRARFPDAPGARGRSAVELISYVADRPGHDRRYAIDSSKIQRELDYQPGISMNAGLRATLWWYLNNESWWRAVMDGRYRQWITTHYAGRN
jgi:dTDP-glucose 4,6-dehydratase